MVRASSESIAETVAVLIILFAPMLGGVMTLVAVLAGIAIVVFATGRRLTPVMILAALGAFVVGLLVAYSVRAIPLSR